MLPRVKKFLPHLIGVAAGCVAVIASLLVPTGTHGGSNVRACQENLTKIDGAKEQFALRADRWPGFPAIVWTDIAPANGTGYLKTFPKCPSGGKYVVGGIGIDPICTSGLPGHSLSEVGLAITTTK